MTKVTNMIEHAEIIETDNLCDPYILNNFVEMLLSAEKDEILVTNIFDDRLLIVKWKSRRKGDDAK